MIFSIFFDAFKTVLKRLIGSKDIMCEIDIIHHTTLSGHNNMDFYMHLPYGDAYMYEHTIQ